MYKIIHMESCSNPENVIQIQIFIFRFFKVATLCLDDCFAHSWHSLNHLHLECFSNGLEGVPTCWVLVSCYSFTLLSNSSQTISIRLRSGDWRPGHLKQHSSSWSNCPYTAWRCVGSLSCWKTNDSFTKHRPDGWRITAECCGSYSG